MTKLGRTLREGYRNFRRDGWLSFATVSVLTLSLYTISITLFLIMVGTSLTHTVQGKVSISAYFYPSVGEDRIMEVKKDLEHAAGIASVTYVSRDQALAEFKSTARDPIIRDALAEFEKTGDNPLYASLVIRAHDPRDYQGIADTLGDNRFKDIVSEVNYAKNEGVIQRITQITDIVRRVGTTLGAIFVAIAVLVVYNTVRITMFTRRKEFEIMRLVGASNTYARMPSVYESVLYGATASVATIVLMALTTYFLSPIAQKVMPGSLTLFDFYLSYFGRILLYTTGTAVVLAVISSFIAIRRYLRV